MQTWNIFQGYTVQIGSRAYDQQKREAEKAASESGGTLQWRDDYNDTRASGHFVVTRRL